jgi:hypothetical protein
MRWTFVVAALAAFLTVPESTFAQAEPDDEETAEDQEQEEYESGTDAIDEEEWADATRSFDRVIAMKGKRADAALYWKAYALSREGRRPDALAALAQLKSTAPQSRWLDDAKALEIEIRQQSGQPPRVESQSDEEMKLIAINSLMHRNPEEAVPMLEKFLAGGGSVKLKKKALFVLSQGGSPRAREVVTEIARGRRSPQLQSEALKYLGLFGGEQSRAALADIYAGTSDVEVKKEILHSFMLSGDKARVIAAAKGEKNAVLREAAVNTLGTMGARDELWQMYGTETSVPVRKSILHAMFLQGNAPAMIQIARAETNPELKKAAVHWLSLMNSKEATAYMLEILDK